MSDPLGALPHQIPFRALSSIRQLQDRRASGEFLVTANDALVEGTPLPAVLLFEAMAQLGGAIVFGAGAPAAWLSAIDAATIDRVPRCGDRLVLEVEAEVSLGSMHRFRGRALDGDIEVARARFVLAQPE